MLSRERDAPPRDGRMQRACLAALLTPGTVAEVAARLRWTRIKAEKWVHWCLRAGLVRRVEWTRTAKGQKAGRYQRVCS